MNAISRVTLACTTLAALIVVAPAQDKPTPPWEILVTGDSLESMKVSIALHEKIDQSTPEGLAAAYCMLADDRAVVDDMEEAARNRWLELLHNALKPHEQKLLGTEAYEALVKSRRKDTKDRTFSFRREASKVSGVEKIDDRNVWVTCTQQSVITRRKAPEAKPETERTEEKMRLHTRKGDDGRWRIEGRQAWQISWDAIDEGEEEYVWEKSETVLWSLLYFEQQKPRQVSELGQSTPEAAASAVLNWLAPTRENFELGAAKKFLGVWSNELKALHTADYINACTESVKRNIAEAEARDTNKAARVIESVADGDNGTKVVKFKAQYEWSGAIELRLKQDGEVWKVVAAGYYEREGQGDAYKYVALADIYELAWR